MTLQFFNRAAAVLALLTLPYYILAGRSNWALWMVAMLALNTYVGFRRDGGSNE